MNNSRGWSRDASSEGIISAINRWGVHVGKINWERTVLFGVSLAFLALSLFKVYEDKVVEAGGIALIAVMCLVFSNLTRFKRFKGLGFEGELWEDKQKEAADLIDRLKNVVSIYTREVIMSNVKRGRWSDGEGWKSRWTLYDDLVTQHADLGQKIDFSDLKYQMDTYFLFDMCMIDNTLQRSIMKAEEKARGIIQGEFGKVVRDMDGYQKRLAQLREIKNHFDEPFAVAQKENLAARMLEHAEENRKK